jgi:hypothetical protein
MTDVPVLLDECMEPEVRHRLRNYGHTVEHVLTHDTLQRGDPDRTLANYSLENNVLIVTHDPDFGEHFDESEYWGALGFSDDDWSGKQVADRDTSAYPRLPVSDECSDTLSEPRSEQAGVERTLLPRNRRPVAGLDDQPNVFVVVRRILICDGIGEMLAPNRQGAVTDTVCSSRSDDTDSDGTCVTGSQPYIEGENESFAGMLPVPSECGLEPKCPGSPGQSSGGRMPRSSGRGGGHS